MGCMRRNHRHAAGLKYLKMLLYLQLKLSIRQINRLLLPMRVLRQKGAYFTLPVSECNMGAMNEFRPQAGEKIPLFHLG